MNLDQEKAFDMINHKYLYSILEKYRLPKPFVKLIKNIYDSAKGKVLVNGALTNPIKGSQAGVPTEHESLCHQL